MAPCAIVEDFDVAEDGGVGGRSRREVRAIEAFYFQSCPEAFGAGIVVAGASIPPN